VQRENVRCVCFSSVNFTAVFFWTIVGLLGYIYLWHCRSAFVMRRPTWYFRKEFMAKIIKVQVHQWRYITFCRVGGVKNEIFENHWPRMPSWRPGKRSCCCPSLPSTRVATPWLWFMIQFATTHPTRNRKQRRESLQNRQDVYMYTSEIFNFRSFHTHAPSPVREKLACKTASVIFSFNFILISESCHLCGGKRPHIWPYFPI